MKINKIIIKKNLRVWIILILLLFSLTIFSNGKLNSHAISNCIIVNIDKEYIVSPPILIDEDSDFATYSSGGDGSSTSPYIIENYNISITSEDGIHVSGTTKHFIIRDCFLNDTTNGDSNKGIYISFLAGGTCTIENNTIENAFNGIMVTNSDFCTIKNNTVISSSYGISVFNSDSTIITENYSFKCISFAGVFCQGGSGCDIIKHTSVLDNTGIFLVDIDNSIIADSNCTESNSGIEIQQSSYVTLINNDLIEMTRPISKISAPSLVILLSQHISVLNNSMLDNQENLGVEVISSNNIEFLNNHIDYNALKGIYMENSYEIFIANNNVTYNGDEGILATDCYDLNITANEISHNSWSGIIFENTNSSDITYNNIEGNSPNYGVYLDATSTDNIIHHNNFIENTPGSPQAKDDGIGNIWYDTSKNEGNYWNDYIPNGDYLLDGTAAAVDPYPLLNPVELPIIPEFSMNNLIFFIITMLGLTSIIYILKKRKSF